MAAWFKQGTKVGAVAQRGRSEGRPLFDSAKTAFLGASNPLSSNSAKGLCDPVIMLPIRKNRLCPFRSLMPPQHPRGKVHCWTNGGKIETRGTVNLPK
jgi:hypothetical protein